jgi:hypothetical protein
LVGILPFKFLNHFSLLSEATFLLLGDDIVEEELTRADYLLQLFYHQFPILYSTSRGSCGLNVHNVGSHLVYFVRQWGPIWAWSCFPFEDSNHGLLQSVHGTGLITKQVMKIVMLMFFCANMDS